tara:strand:+ start:4479 stop:8288 length:3810 start_codon:yes stop_codon:yes gene_type:complete
MKLGDYIKLNLHDSIIQGVITFLDIDNDYIELTVSKNNICQTFIFTDADWEGIYIQKQDDDSYKGTLIENDKKHLFDIDIVQSNILNSFITYKYIDGDTVSVEKELLSNKLYSVVVNQNSNIKPGTYIQINNIDRENQLIYAINTEDDSLEEIVIDVSKGISKKNNDNIFYDLCEIEDDTDSDSDSDNDSYIDDEDEEDIYNIKGKDILEQDKELTKQEKMEFIGKSLNSMHSLNKNDLLKLIKTVYSCLDEQYKPLLTWEQNLNSLKSEHITPILQNYSISVPEEQVFQDDDIYHTFIQNNLSSLLIRNDIETSYTKILQKSPAIDSLLQDIILNPSYLYKNYINILNTADNVIIDKYNINNTHIYIHKLPPSPEDFRKIYMKIKDTHNIFDVFYTSKYNIPYDYIKDIKTITTKHLKLSNYTYKTKIQKDYTLLTKKVPISKKKFNSIGNDNKYKTNVNYKLSPINIEILKDLQWGKNGYIWPKYIGINQLQKFDHKNIHKIIQCFQKNIPYNTIDTNLETFRIRYLQDINNTNTSYNNIFKLKNEKHFKNNELSKDIYKPSYTTFNDTLQPNSLIAWKYANTIDDIYEKNTMKMHILTSGKYLRDFKSGENPYFLYDIETGQKILPRHEILKCQIESATYYTTRKQLYDLLINQWGKSEDNTENIISLINDEYLGSKENSYDFLENMSYVKQFNVEDETTKNVKITRKDIQILQENIRREVFLNGFKTILNTFYSKKQYTNISDLSYNEYNIISNKFYNGAPWLSYLSYYPSQDVLAQLKLNDKNNYSKIDKICKNLVRIDKEFPKRTIAMLNKLKKKEIPIDKIPQLEAFIKKSINISNNNYKNKLYIVAGSYLLSYIFTNLKISSKVKIAIFKDIYEKLSTNTDIPLWATDSNIFNEKYIVRLSEKLWDYDKDTENIKYTYSYSSTKTTFNLSTIAHIHSQYYISNPIKNIKIQNLNIQSVESNTMESSHISTVDSNIDDTVWKLLSQNKIIDDKIKWYFIHDTKSSSQEDEHIYKCLIQQFSTVILQAFLSLETVSLPKKLQKAFQDFGYIDRIKGWVNSIYEIRKNILNKQNYNIIRQIINNDVNSFYIYISNNNLNQITWKKKWTFLMQHLIHEIKDTEELSYTDYLNSLEEIIQEYIINANNMCPQYIVMNKSNVEHIYAKAAEDEASQHYTKQANDKISQQIIKEEMNRNLGDYASGTKKQFDMSTILTAEESLKNYFTDKQSQKYDEYTTSHQESHTETSFNNDYGQDFDNDYFNEND